MANNRPRKDSYIIFGIDNENFSVIGVKNDTNRRNQQGITDISSREPNYNQLLIFENEDDKQCFDLYVSTHFNDHADDEVKIKYQYQIQEDNGRNLGGLIYSAFQVAKIAWLYEDWLKQR